MVRGEGQTLKTKRYVMVVEFLFVPFKFLMLAFTKTYFVLFRLFLKNNGVQVLTVQLSTYATHFLIKR